MSLHSMIGKLIFHTSCMVIEFHSIHQQEFHHFYCYMVDMQPATCQSATQLGYDLLSYPAHLQARLSELQDFVHTNLTQATCSQKFYYDHHTMQSTFVSGDPVWLSIPTADKLDPRWEGEWVIKSVKGPVTMEISDSKKRTKVVHTNRLQHRYAPGQHDATELSNTTNENDCLEWTPSSVERVILPPTEQIW